MKKAKQGRPVSGAEHKRRYQVTLAPKTAEKLRVLGGDNLSRGIELASRKVSKQEGT